MQRHSSRALGVYARHRVPCRSIRRIGGQHWGTKAAVTACQECDAASHQQALGMFWKGSVSSRVIAYQVYPSKKN